MSNRRCSWRTCARRSARWCSRPTAILYALWLFVHNGYIGDFHAIRRDLMLAIDPGLFADITGSTDTEVVFRLALTFGLEDVTRSRRSNAPSASSKRRRPSAASLRWCRALSASRRRQPVGRRYATEGRARSLFASADVATVRQLAPQPAGRAPDRR